MAYPRLIGLAGVAGSGKSTIAEAMEDLGYEAHSFGEALKEIAERLYGVDIERFHEAKEMLKAGLDLDPETAEFAAKVRKRLRWIGDHLRAEDPEALLRAATRFADMSLPSIHGPCPSCLVHEGGQYRPRVVWDDVRRKDEVQAIKKRGGQVLWVEAPSLWGAAPSGDTGVDPQLDCDGILDLTSTAEACASLRAAARRREAVEVFRHGGLAALARLYGMPVPEAPVLREPEEVPDDEDEDADIEALAAIEE